VAPGRFSRRTWTLIGVLVLLQAGLVVLIVYLFTAANRRAQEENAEADRLLQEAMAEADRLDPHWRLEDLEAQRAAVPDQQNSALVVIAAKKRLPRSWPFWDYPRTADEAAGAEQERRALQESFENLEPPAQLHERQITALRTELKRAESALALARKLADLPDGRYRISYRPDYISTLFPDIQDARWSASLLANDTLLRAQEQDMKGALASCRGTLNAGRSVGEEPVIIAQLVRLACQKVALTAIERTVAQGQAKEASLAALQKLLEKEAAAPLLLVMVRGERACLDRLMQTLETTDPEKVTQILRQLSGGRKEEDTTVAIPPCEIKIQRAALLRYLTQGVEIAKLPPRERRRRIAQLEAGVKDQPCLVRLLAPAVVRVADHYHRSQAQLRCAVAALAVERYRLAHQGHWPGGLAALVPRYLGQVPTDPYDGTPLRFRRTGDGVVIYSPGPDGKNKDGWINPDKPGNAGTDTAFRLWEVAKRRQPAKPFRRKRLGPPDGLPPQGSPLPDGENK
jgi:hypothetical protein